MFGIITTKWVLAIVLFTHNLFNTEGFTKVAKFGVCHSNEGDLQTLISFTLPLFLTSFLATVLNVYLTIKAYQVHKQIQEESKLSGGHSRGDNDQLKALKKKQATIKKHFKPMITLLVVVLGSSSIGLLLPLLFIQSVNEGVIRYVIVPNMGFFSILFHPFVYGLYFKQVREPMMRLLNRITCPCKCKSAAVAPQPQRNRINWLNPN